jgi:L-ascorbate metabolism protein UlaG (beta-lactamase superfamily)
MKQVIKPVAMVFFISILFTGMVSGSDMNSPIKFHPIKHATMVIQSKTATIYVDPVGDPELFSQYPKPDLILITDIHRDHLNKEVVDAVKHPDTLIIATKDAVTQLKEGRVLNNGESFIYKGINIEAIPAYNLTTDRLKFHPRGRGNGYVIVMLGKRIYLSGDTEDIPEMRMLKDIDYAFICMNLPYTMTEGQAAAAVLEFKPKVVIPYHYRGKNGFSDIDKFKNMVERDGDIQVKLLTWY